MLAGLIRSPSYYDPYTRPQEVLERRNARARADAQDRVTSPATRWTRPTKEPMNLAPPNKVYVVRRAPYFCDYITELVRKKYGDQQAFRGGLRIYTTIDLRLQDIAESTLQEATRSRRRPRRRAGLHRPTHRVHQGDGRGQELRRQPVQRRGRRPPAGRLLLQGVRAGAGSRRQRLPRVRPTTPLPRRVIRLPDGGKWKVNNYDGHGSGSTTIKNATIHSINVVFAQLIMDVGPARVAEMAKSMGIQSTVESNPAIALGGLRVGVTPLEMASAFGTLANGGVHAVARSISKITDADGNIIEEGKPETDTAFSTRRSPPKANEILQEVVSSGTGTGASIGRPQAGKTGTTEDHADAWFVGYTPDLVAAVLGRLPAGTHLHGRHDRRQPARHHLANVHERCARGRPPTAFQHRR